MPSCVFCRTMAGPSPVTSPWRFSRRCFPFLIFVTALAGFFGTKTLADEAVSLLFLQTWPQQVAAPIANEIHDVLTHTRSGLLTIGVILAIYFSSSGVEAIRIGLNRAYGVVEMRAWWLFRLESIAYVFVGALSLLTLALFVVFAPVALVRAAAFRAKFRAARPSRHIQPVRDCECGAFDGAGSRAQISAAGRRSFVDYGAGNRADHRRCGSPPALPSAPTSPNSPAIMSRPTRGWRRS